MSRGHLAAFLLATTAAAAVIVVATIIVLAGISVLAGSGSVSASELTPPPIVESGDPRSEGSGPGIVGSPLMIALGVVALGAITAGATAVAVRIGRRR